MSIHERKCKTIKPKINMSEIKVSLTGSLGKSLEEPKEGNHNFSIQVLPLLNAESYTTTTAKHKQVCSDGRLKIKVWQEDNQIMYTVEMELDPIDVP